jgi:hypothetical protein
MRIDNLAVLNNITLADLEHELDRHTREIVEPDRWMMFNWSVSRHHMYQDCKRQYYLNYYGARRVREARSKVVSAVWWLKQVRPLKMWLGTVIHAIAKKAVRAHANGEPVDDAALVEEALAYYRGGVRASERGAKHDNQWVVLLEDVYPTDTFSIDHDLAETMVVDMARTLLGSDAMGFVRTMPPDAVLEVDEEFQSFELAGITPRGSLTVFAIPDVLIADGSDYYLIDWKTGDVEREGIRDQAGVYRFYVHQQYGAPEESIHVAIADVGQTGESVEPPGGVPGLDETREFIGQSAGSMLARLVDQAYNTATIKDFPMTDDLNLCRGCGFKRACWRHE